MDIHPFGYVDPEALDDCYEGEVELSGREILVELCFDEETIDADQLTGVEKFINRMKDFEDAALKYVRNDYNRGQDSQAARLFVEHHLEEFSSDQLVDVFGAKNVDVELFLSKLILRDVAIYPEDEEEFAVFDITLRGNVTDYALAVKFDRDGEISGVSMES